MGNSFRAAPFFHVWTLCLLLVAIYFLKIIVFILLTEYNCYLWEVWSDMISSVITRTRAPVLCDIIQLLHLLLVSVCVLIFFILLFSASVLIFKACLLQMAYNRLTDFIFNPACFFRVQLHLIQSLIF